MTLGQAEIRPGEMSAVYDLRDWLGRAGVPAAATSSRPQAAGTQGPLVDVLTVALSGTSVTALLINKVYDYIQLRRNVGPMSLELTDRYGKKLKLEVPKGANREKLLHDAMKFFEGESAE